METFYWLVPLLLIWPLIKLAQLFLVTRLLLGLRLSADESRQVQWEELPLYLREASAPLLAQWAELGFGPLYFTKDSSKALPDIVISMIVLGRPGDAVRIHLRQPGDGNAAGVLNSSLMTSFSDGTELVSCQHAEAELLPNLPDVRVHCDGWVPLSELLRRHRERVAALETAGTAALVLDVEGMSERRRVLLEKAGERLPRLPQVQKNSDGSYSFKLRHAVVAAWRLLRSIQQRAKVDAALRKDKAAAALRPGTPPPLPTGFEPGTVPVLSEEALDSFDMEARRRNKAVHSGRMGTAAKTWLMLLSLLAFSLTLGWQLNFELALVLLGVLVFHECGHLAGMWLFGYKDTQLLFIPFLGGAAVGHDERVLEPWKHLVILFLGPLPGLFAAIAVLSFVPELPGFAMLVCIVSISLNLFNLLPFLPLDGGQVVDYSFAHRFPRVHAIFFAFSGAALAITGLLLDLNVLLLALGVFMLVQVPLKWRLAGLIRVVRFDLPEQPTEEELQRCLFRALRAQPEGRANWAWRQQQAPALLHNLRLPRPGWGTMLFAALAYTSPLWLGVGPLVIGTRLREQRRQEAFHAQLKTEGFVVPDAPAPAGAEDPTLNGALALAAVLDAREVMQEEARAKALAGQRFVPASQGEALSSALVDDILSKPVFRMPDRYRHPSDATGVRRIIKSRTWISTYCFREEGGAEDDLRAALKSLQLSERMRQDAVWWGWSDSLTLERYAMSLLCGALEKGARLDAAQQQELRRLLDERAWLREGANRWPMERVTLQSWRLMTRTGTWDDTQGAGLVTRATLLALSFADGVGTYEYTQELDHTRALREVLRRCEGGSVAPLAEVLEANKNLQANPNPLHWDCDGLLLDLAQRRLCLALLALAEKPAGTIGHAELPLSPWNGLPAKLTELNGERRLSFQPPLRPGEQEARRTEWSMPLK